MSDLSKWLREEADLAESDGLAYTAFEQRAAADEIDRIPDLERRLEACRRYFEHCERVSLSARHAGCDSGEMKVRQSLKREAVKAAKEQSK